MNNTDIYLVEYAVSEILSKIPNLNSGGCLFSAYSVLQFLRKNNCEERYKLVALYTDEKLFKRNIQFFKGKGKPSVANHFGWTLNSINEFNDSTGEYNKIGIDIESYHIISDHNMIDEIYKCLYSSFHWKTDFDRKYIRIIEKSLDIKLTLV